MIRLSPIQQRALRLMAPAGTRVHYGAFPATYYCVNGDGPVIRARTLWALVDRGLVDRRTVKTQTPGFQLDVFSISDAGRAAVSSADGPAV